MTAKNILINWLKQYYNRYIYYHDIEKEIVGYGVNYFNRIHNAGSYSRVFRDLKDNNQALLKANGIVLLEQPQRNKVGKWLVAKWEGKDAG